MQHTFTAYVYDNILKPGDIGENSLGNKNTPLITSVEILTAMTKIDKDYSWTPLQESMFMVHYFRCARDLTKVFKHYFALKENNEFVFLLYLSSVKYFTRIYFCEFGSMKDFERI